VWIDGLLAYLATYTVHSTLLLGAVWAALALARRTTPRTAQRLWRAALFGPLLSAALPTLGGFEPLLGAHVSGFTAARAPVIVASLADGAERRHWAPAVLPERVPARAAASAAAVPAGPLDSVPVGVLAFGLWAAGALVRLTRLARARGELLRCLAPRRSAAIGPAARALAAVAKGCGPPPRLSTSIRVSVPIAFGVWRPEICLPSRAVDELASAELEAVLAHELGHLKGRDPLWLALANTVGVLCWFQPLAAFARRQLRHLSELEADRFAAINTGAPLPLAQALVRVAGWRRPGATPLVAHAMASAGVDLGERVERLIDGRAEAPNAPARIAALCAALMLGATAVAAPAWAPPGAAPRTSAEPAADVAALKSDLRDLRVRLALDPARSRERAELAELTLRLERIELLREELDALLLIRAALRAEPATAVPQPNAALRAAPRAP